MGDKTTLNIWYPKKLPTMLVQPKKMDKWKMKIISGIVMALDLEFGHIQKIWELMWSISRGGLSQWQLLLLPHKFDVSFGTTHKECLRIVCFLAPLDPCLHIFISTYMSEILMEFWPLPPLDCRRSLWGQIESVSNCAVTKILIVSRCIL